MPRVTDLCSSSRVLEQRTSSCSNPGFLLRPTAMAVLMGILALSACGTGTVPHEAILGKWKSNAPLTLQSMHATDGLAPQSRALLNNAFFGHMETEIRETESRTTNKKDNYDSGFEPYTVLEVTERFVRIKAWNSFFQDYDVRTLYLEGNCYYEIFKVFHFRQYFCREG